MILENDFILVINETIDQIKSNGEVTPLKPYNKGDWTLQTINSMKINLLQIKLEKHGVPYKILYLYVGDDVEELAIKEFEKLVEDFNKRIVNFI